MISGTPGNGGAADAALANDRRAETAASGADAETETNAEAAADREAVDRANMLPMRRVWEEQEQAKQGAIV